MPELFVEILKEHSEYDLARLLAKAKAPSIKVKGGFKLGN